jgi:hypothetical protein
MRVLVRQDILLRAWVKEEVERGREVGEGLSEEEILYECLVEEREVF